jgi:hypothetical protein
VASEGRYQEVINLGLTGPAGGQLLMRLYRIAQRIVIQEHWYAGDISHCLPFELSE